MQSLARVIDAALGQQYGFSLLVWPPDEQSKVNYVSNIPKERRDEIETALREVLKRWETSGR